MICHGLWYRRRKRLQMTRQRIPRKFIPYDNPDLQPEFIPHGSASRATNLRGPSQRLSSSNFRSYALNQRMSSTSRQFGSSSHC